VTKRQLTKHSPYTRSHPHSAAIESPASTVQQTICVKADRSTSYQPFSQKEGARNTSSNHRGFCTAHKLTASLSQLSVYRYTVSASFVRYPSQRSSSGPALVGSSRSVQLRRACSAFSDVSTPHHVPGSLQCFLCRREDEQAFLNDPCPAESMLMSMLGSKLEDGLQGCIEHPGR
jgi:hypothetical protein